MDDVTVVLPVSKRQVIIRGYTTHGDDEAAEQMMYDGVDATTDAEGNQKFSLSMSKVMASKRIYIERMVKSVDGDSRGIANQLSDLHSKDYEAVKLAVDSIVEAHSPKAQEVLNASENSTTQK